MLTSIFRYAPRLEAGVGPRFADLLPYTRPGLSLLVRKLPAQLLPTPSRMFDVRLIAQTKVRQVMGTVQATATVTFGNEDYGMRNQQPTSAIAVAKVVGVALSRQFGSYE